MVTLQTTPTGSATWQFAGWLTLGMVLVAGAPLFVCQPLWQDATQYDVMAQELLRGRVHYRDFTDTNFPGVVLIHAAVRSVAGYRSEALRLFDLLVVGAIAVLLPKLATTGRPHSAAVRLFGGAAILAYYFSCAPACHCQRDPWMLLPAALAVCLQYRRIAAAPQGAWRVIVESFAEGLCWGIAIWIKPHVVVPAVCCWLAGLAYRRFAQKQPIGRAALDSLGMLGGGLAVGVGGLVWLYLAGSWPYFWEMMLQWSGEYRSIATWGRRFGTTLSWFIFYSPWSLLHFVALPVAGWQIVRAFRSEPSDAPPASTAACLLMSALYLGWMFQALLLQLTHEYVLAATVLIAIPVLLTWEKIAAPAPWMRIGMAAFVAWAIAMHPLIKPQALCTWPMCFTEGSSPTVKDRQATSRAGHVNGTAHWQDLALVEDFLRQRHVADFELTSWDDTSQYLYTQLHVSPGSRFMHLAQWFNFFPSRAEQLRRDVRESQTRYIITDCQMAGYSANIARIDAHRDTAKLPDEIDPRLRTIFPWNQPVVFRAGRYLVHQVEPSPTDEPGRD